MKYTSDSIAAIAAALAKAQGEIKLPEKNRTVTVRTNAGGSYEFDYADLAAITNVIREPLSKNGLAYTHSITRDDQGKIFLATTLIHSSGEWLSSFYPLSGTNPKEVGGAITYGRRYSLCALLGIVAEDDNDGATADPGVSPKAKTPTPKPPAVNQPPVNQNSLGPKKGPSDAQLSRLRAIASHAGWPQEDVKLFVEDHYDLTSTKDLSLAQYEELCKTIQEFKHPSQWQK